MQNSHNFQSISFNALLTIKFKYIQIFCMYKLSVQVGKLPKPLVERRRRARINASVDALRDILPTTHTDARTDKADVLEMAVNHLKQLRKRRREARDKRARSAQCESFIVSVFS